MGLIKQAIEESIIISVSRISQSEWRVQFENDNLDQEDVDALRVLDFKYVQPTGNTKERRDEVNANLAKRKSRK